MSRQKPAFTPYFTEADAGQVRAAFLAAGEAEGYGSVSDFEAGTLREVRRLQRKHNRGRKWEPAPAGTLRPGRHTAEEQQRRL